MFFVGVAMNPQVVEQGIGGLEGGDVFRGKKGGQTPLSVAVGALDFAFGLRGGRVAQGDVVEAQGGPELGKSFGRAGEEKGMIIDVESQGQAVNGKGPGEQIEVAQEVFARVEPGGGNDATVIVDEFEQSGLARTTGEPGVGRGIVLPQGADLRHLPATHRLAPGPGGPDGFKPRAKAQRRIVARSRLIPRRRSSSHAAKL